MHNINNEIDQKLDLIINYQSLYLLNFYWINYFLMVLTFAYVTLLLENVLTFHMSSSNGGKQGFDISYVILSLEASKHAFKSPKELLI